MKNKQISSASAGLCLTSVGFGLVLLLKHKRYLSSWGAVVLGVQGALSLLLLPLAWPNNQIVGRSCRNENWHVCEVALK